MAIFCIYRDDTQMNAITRVNRSRAEWRIKAVVRGARVRYLTRRLRYEQGQRRDLRDQLRVHKGERAQQKAMTSPDVVPGGNIIQLKTAAAIRTISVQLVTEATISFRAVPRTLEITHPGVWNPHFTSVINWTLRVGLAKLQTVAPAPGPWVAIIDISIDIGLSKLLVVLRVPLDALARRGSAITLEDCEVIGLRIRSTWNGESISEALTEIFAVSGNPTMFLKDEGSDLKKGVRIWRESNDQKRVPVGEDISHIAGNALKCEFDGTPGFKRFTEYVRKAAGKLWQSDVAYLAPPRPRTKGRFLGIYRLARWAKRLVPLLGGKGRVEENTIAGRVRKLAGGLAPLKGFLDHFITTCEVVETVLAIAKNEGMNQQNYRRIMDELAKLSPKSHTRNRLERWAKRHIHIHCRLGIGQIPVITCTDIIESLFGKFKTILARNPKAEMNHLALAIPCLCGPQSEAFITQALENVSHRDLLAWRHKNVPKTQRRLRVAFNRGQLTPDMVPKSAHSNSG